MDKVTLLKRGMACNRAGRFHRYGICGHVDGKARVYARGIVRFLMGSVDIGIYSFVGGIA
jgi:hypothetical protein